MKHTKITLLITMLTLAISASCLIYTVHSKNEIASLTTTNIAQGNNIEKSDIYVSADSSDSYSTPDLRKLGEAFRLSEDHKTLILPNPKENECLLKYEIVFKDYNFSICTEGIPAGESREMNLYDILEAGTYDISLKISPWRDEDTRFSSTGASFETLLDITK